MAVRLTIYYKEGDRHESVPVAFQTIFEEVWQPLAVRLNLEWVARLNMLRFSAQNAPQVDALIAELDRLQQWIATGEDWLSDRARQLQVPERITILLDTLTTIQANWAQIESFSVC